MAGVQRVGKKETGARSASRAMFSPCSLLPKKTENQCNQEGTDLNHEKSEVPVGFDECFKGLDI